MQFLFCATILISAAVAHPHSASPRVDDHLCIGKTNGEKVATTTCNAFVTCYDGVATAQSCETGKLFNSTVNECDRAQNVKCDEVVGAPQGPAPSCQGRVGQMLRNPYDCSSFYFCEHNAALLFYCEKGLFFDTTINNCNWKENVQCRTDQLPTDADAPVRGGGG